jgi:DNA invertase Pin-like site-specific DNA recombinase
MVYGYISASLNPSVELKKEIMNYAKSKNLDVTYVIEDEETNKTHWGKRDISSLIQTKMQQGDEVIVYEASQMARSTSQVLEIMELITQKGIILHLVKYNEVFTGEKTVDTRSFIKLIQHIESDFVAKRTTEALARRRSAGLPLGRPKGRCNKTLKLDKYRKEIQKYLNLGVSKASIAKLINCHAQTLYNYIEKRALRPQTVEEREKEVEVETV